MTDSRLCYVIMPFDESYRPTYTQAILPAFPMVSRERGEPWECRRGDDVRSSGSISSEIVKSLHNADLVIADLSGNNPNVLYELGLAHSFGKPTILITQDINELPFDIKSYRVLTYDGSSAGLKAFAEKLVVAILHSLSGKEATTNPVFDFAPIRHAQIILTLDLVRRLERSVREEVWLIEPSLDTDLKMFGEIIRGNLERGITYRYLLPQLPDTERQLQRFLNGVGLTLSKPSQLEFRMVEQYLIESEVVIYDPYTQWEDVMLMSPRENDPVFWYRVGARRGQDIRDRYEFLWANLATRVPPRDL